MTLIDTLTLTFVVELLSPLTNQLKNKKENQALFRRKDHKSKCRGQKKQSPSSG